MNVLFTQVINDIRFHFALPSAFGMLVVMVLNILTNTRKTVTKSVMRPGTISAGTRKLIHDTITNIPEGR